MKESRIVSSLTKKIMLTIIKRQHDYIYTMEPVTYHTLINRCSDYNVSVAGCVRPISNQCWGGVRTRFVCTYR